jgi:cytochrome P450
MSAPGRVAVDGAHRSPALPRLLDPEILADPYRALGRIRERAPVLRAQFLDDSPIWLVTRYEDVRTVLSDSRFGTDPASITGGHASHAYADTLMQLGIAADLIPYLAESVLERDPPDHTRLRKLVARAFTPRRIADLRPRVEEIAANLLAALPEHAEGGVVDLIEHFTFPLPITVICEMVGVAEADRPWWGQWSSALMSMDPAIMGTAARKIVDHVEEMIRERRGDLRQDLLSDLIKAHDEGGDQLSDVELVTMVLTLVVAGHETTANLIANGTAALLTHPDQLALIKRDPGLLPGAIHELQRWCGPVLLGQVRYAREDIELGGVHIRRGESVEALLVSANHDPRRFPRPELLDITRHAEQHVGFGYGAHHCLGAALARQEAEVALAALFRHYPDLALAIPADRLPWERSPGFRRLKRLPVRPES